jgi:hypothetical protein
MSGWACMIASVALLRRHAASFMMLQVFLPTPRDTCTVVTSLLFCLWAAAPRNTCFCLPL